MTAVARTDVPRSSAPGPLARAWSRVWAARRLVERNILVYRHQWIIIVSGALEVHQQISALQGPRRAHYVVNKPVDLAELKKTIETALQECGETEVLRGFEALERSKRIDAEFLFSRSTDRLSRQTEIRKLVSSAKSRPNISALARQFRVARRTIIRDLQELIRRGEVAPEVFPKWEQPNVEDEE